MSAACRNLAWILKALRQIGLGKIILPPTFYAVVSDEGAVAFFDLQNGLKLGLWARKSLSHDSGIALSSLCPTEFTLGHNVTSKEEIDEVMDQVKVPGARIVKSAQATFWGGYAGYFQDPDGHLWEVVWNPELMPVD